jgi:peptidoglycan/xylan/chitin deacetylase (PgdA/CDA1 family)
MIGALRSAALVLARGLEVSGALDLLERIGGRSGEVLRALTWHRVTERDADPSCHPGLVNATPAEFAAQVAFLAARYRVVSMDEVLDARRTGRALPPRALLLTFDDAYHDFAEHAWPLLRRHGLPVTLFVPTAYPDHPELAFWWDRLHQALHETARRDVLEAGGARVSLGTAEERSHGFRVLRERVKRLPHDEAMALVDRICGDLGAFPTLHRVLGWDALRALAREGVTLASHTRTHPLLNRLPPERIRAEVLGSLEDLRREVGAALPVFAYPSGGFDDRAVRVLAREGIELAFTTRRGADRIHTVDPLRLRRVPVGSHATRAALRLQMLPLTALGSRRGAFTPRSAAASRAH